MLNILIIKNLYLIIIFPLIAFLYEVIFKGHPYGLKITRNAWLLNLIFVLFALFHCIRNPHYMLENAVNWINLGYSKIAVQTGIIIDLKSVYLSFLITTAALVIFYKFLKNSDPNEQRACKLLNIAGAVLLGFILSSNLLQAAFLCMLLTFITLILANNSEKMKDVSLSFETQLLADFIILFVAVMLVYYAYNWDISQGIGLLSFVNVDFWASLIYDAKISIILSFGVLLKIFSSVNFIMKNRKWEIFLLPIFLLLCFCTEFVIRLDSLYQTDIASIVILSVICTIFAFIYWQRKIIQKITLKCIDLFKNLEQVLQKFLSFIFIGTFLNCGNLLTNVENRSLKYHICNIVLTLFMMFLFLTFIYYSFVKV